VTTIITIAGAIAMLFLLLLVIGLMMTLIGLTTIPQDLNDIRLPTEKKETPIDSTNDTESKARRRRRS